MKKLFLLAAALSSALVLTACGGGGGAETVTVAATDTTLAITPATGIATTTAVLSKEFDFPAGVPALGTTGTTTVTFTPAATGNPGFAITEAGTGTATGVMEFGSCIFLITESTFPPTHRLAKGNKVTVNSCNVKVNTDDVPADGVSRTRNANLLLNEAASTGEPVTVHVNPGGQFTLNNVFVNTVTLVFVSGG